MKVKDILADKGTTVITVHEEKTVFEAMHVFAKNKVGSLLVLNDKNDPVGIIGARDVLMETLRVCEGIKKTKVNEIMTRDIIVGSRDDDIAEVEIIMTNNRIRHLPIVEQGKICGIISIGDLVKAQLKDMNVQNKYLNDYITGKYPG
ncbi:MAG: CBS domain-containing protein [bacterium]|nr:CBS domain-containing protein [bacterium]